MSHPLICSALGVAPDQWPPDHYTLLGISPGPVEPSEVEECVLERMEQLRRYQLVHPEAVTDAMNRLAQALVCLSDPSAKAEYDAELGRTEKSREARSAVPPPTTPAVVPIEPVHIAARRPPPAPHRPQRDGHRRLLFHRLAVARRLLAAWRELGRFIGSPNHRVRRSAEAIDMAGALLELRDCLRDDEAPAIGPPGQTGALVAALARQPLPISTYRQFLSEQRAALAADWREGERVLSEHYRQMARTIHRPRRHSLRRVSRQAAKLVLTDWLDIVLIAVGCAAIAIALRRSF